MFTTERYFKNSNPRLGKNDPTLPIQAQLFTKKDLHLTAIKYDYGWVRTPCELLNIGFRHWEHQWIYDKNELTQMAQLSGFNDISEKEINQSNHHELCNKEHRSPEASLILEFKKPEPQLIKPAVAYLFFENLISTKKSTFSSKRRPNNIYRKKQFITCI